MIRHFEYLKYSLEFFKCVERLDEYILRKAQNDNRKNVIPTNGGI
ncbi:MULTISPECIES: hypothetical protein [Empedobacter]|nr:MULTISPECIES: hypothetical protein [Empedobacter]MDH2206175.1 hypothetical protein [Empedobacter sp. GD03644]